MDCGAFPRYGAPECCGITLKGDSKFWKHVRAPCVGGCNRVHKSWVHTRPCVATQCRGCPAGRRDPWAGLQCGHEHAGVPWGVGSLRPRKEAELTVTAMGSAARLAESFRARELPGPELVTSGITSHAGPEGVPCPCFTGRRSPTSPPFCPPSMWRRDRASETQAVSAQFAARPRVRGADTRATTWEPGPAGVTTWPALQEASCPRLAPGAPASPRGPVHLPQVCFPPPVPPGSLSTPSSWHLAVTRPWCRARTSDSCTPHPQGKKFQNVWVGPLLIEFVSATRAAARRSARTCSHRNPGALGRASSRGGGEPPDSCRTASRVPGVPGASAWWPPAACSPGGSVCSWAGGGLAEW